MKSIIATVLLSLFSSIPALAYIGEFQVGEGLSESCGIAVIQAFESDPDLYACLEDDYAEETHIELSDADKVEVMVMDGDHATTTALFQIQYNAKTGNCSHVRLIHWDSVE